MSGIIIKSGVGLSGGIKFTVAAAVETIRAIAVGHATTPYVSVYPWSSGFGTKYANPATLPLGFGTAPGGIKFSPSGADLAVPHQSSPFISVYPWSSGFGTKYANPDTLPTGAGWGVAFSP